jgi:hypothetical protein
MLLLMLIACTTNGTDRAKPRAGPSLTDLQARCESALDTTTATPVQNLLLPDTAWQFALPDQLGTVASLDWDPDKQLLFALDPMNSKIAILTQDGHILRSFGRRGMGPSDLDFGPSRRLMTRLALAGDSAVVVADLRSVKLFSRSGNYEWGVVVDTTGAGSAFDLNIAAARSGDVIASRTGKFRLAAQDMATRTALDLVRFVPSGRGVIQQPLVRLRNSFATLDSFVGTPPQQPYRDSYHRSWGIAGDGVTFISWQVFGLCHTSFSGRQLQVMRLDAKRIPIDDAEKRRVLQQEQGGGDKPLPFLHVTGKQLYEGKWPKAGPVYQDMLVDDRGRTVAVRRIADGRSVVDLYSDGGYRGSFPMPVGYALGVFKSSLLILLRIEDSHVLALRLPEKLLTAAK